MDTLVAREREFIAREEASLDFQDALLDAQPKRPESAAVSPATI